MWNRTKDGVKYFEIIACKRSQLFCESTTFNIFAKSFKRCLEEEFHSKKCSRFVGVKVKTLNI